MHLCGRCRTTFADIAEFFNHKKLCKEQSKKKLDNNDFNLATDEAAVISLLANQLSSQNSQPRASDDLDHLTLVFKGQLISKGLFDVIVSTKKTNEISLRISALASKKRSDQKTLLHNHVK